MISYQLSSSKKGDVQAMVLSSLHDEFGARLAADDRGERACRGFLSGAHVFLIVESGLRCGELSKACDGPLGADVCSPRLGPQ